jgi:hypothetical protein
MPHLPPAHHETSKHDSPNETKVKEKQNKTVPDSNSNLTKSITHHNQTKELITWFLKTFVLSCLSQHLSHHSTLHTIPENISHPPLRISKRVFLMVPVSNPRRYWLARNRGFLRVFWLFLPMEGMEHLSLTKDGLDDDPMFSYTQAQLCHHEVA